MRKPYIVRSDVFGGAATIVDRRTQASVGRVLQDFHGRWEAIAWTYTTEGRRAETVAWCRYRREAAEVVWRAFLRGEEASNG